MKNIIISVVIPCLNEAATIEKAVDQAKKALITNKITECEIIVADNGSTDGSIEKISKQNIAHIVKVPVRGYGAALHWGILKAMGKFIIFADADLSYDFSDIKKFIPLIQQNYDLVLGSRLKGKISKGAMPFLNRYFGTPILTFLIRVLYGIKTTDCNSGMRMVKKDFYKKLNMRNSGMEWASELLLKTAIKKGKYAEVNISFYKDKRGRHPHLSRWADGWRHLKAIVLIKPNFLFSIVIFFGFLSILLIKNSFGLSYFFALLSGALFLSIIAAKMLNYAIDRQKSRIIHKVNKLPIVFFALLLTVLSFVLLFIIPDKHLGTKLFISSAVIIFDVWVFLIETIKTHLINSLDNR